MTQTYLVPAKTAESIAKEQFSNIIDLEIKKFITKEKSSDKFAKKIAFLLEEGKGKHNTQIDRITNRYLLAKELMTSINKSNINDINTRSVLNHIGLSFSYGKEYNELLNLDFDAELKSRIKTIESDYNEEIQYVINMKLHLDHSFENTTKNELMSRITNRIRLSKIESYDNIVKKVSAKIDFPAEIENINSMLIELNK